MGCARGSCIRSNVKVCVIPFEELEKRDIAFYQTDLCATECGIHEPRARQESLVDRAHELNGDGGDGVFPWYGSVAADVIGALLFSSTLTQRELTSTPHISHLHIGLFGRNTSNSHSTSIVPVWLRSDQLFDNQKPDFITSSFAVEECLVLALKPLCFGKRLVSVSENSSADHVISF